MAIARPLSGALTRWIEADREIVRRGGLHAFARLAWDHIPEPQGFVDSWHIDEVCEHLTALSDGTIRNLIINIPPGTSKSILTGVIWPAWHWINDPGFKFIFASYDSKLVLRDSLKCRRLLTSTWFRERWPGAIRLTHETRNTQGEFENTAGGFRKATTIKGGVTGSHADALICDDPMKPDEAEHSKDAFERVTDWWDGTFMSRRANPTTTRTLVVMQRLHVRDLCGHLMQKYPDTEVLSLPMRYEPKYRSITSIGGDRREKAGELLCPVRIPETEVKAQEVRMGPTRAAAQLQQRPFRDGGAIFRKEWLQRRWTSIPADARWFTSWDLSFEKGEDNDYVTGQAWAHAGATLYLVDRLKLKLSFDEALREFLLFAKKHPQANCHYVEKKANGPALQAMLHDRIPGIVMVEPLGSKTARAMACEPFYAAGNILHPPEETCSSWWDEYETELIQFPKAQNDDEVDSTTQAILKELTGTTNYEAMISVINDIGAMGL